MKGDPVPGLILHGEQLCEGDYLYFKYGEVFEVTNQTSLDDRSHWDNTGNAVHRLKSSKYQDEASVYVKTLTKISEEEAIEWLLKN